MPRNKYTDALYTVLSEKLGKQWSDGIDVDAFADSVQTNPKYADAGFDVLSAEIEGLDKDKYYEAIGFQAKTDTDTETELAKDGTAEKAKPREFTQMWQQGESPLDRDVIEKNKLAEPTYTEEDKAKFEAIDANPRLLMGEDRRTQQKYAEYKKILEPEPIRKSVNEGAVAEAVVSVGQDTNPDYMGLFDKKEIVKKSEELGVSTGFFEKVGDAASKAEYRAEAVFNAHDLKSRIEKFGKHYPEYKEETDALLKDLYGKNKYDLADIEERFSNIESGVSSYTSLDPTISATVRSPKYDSYVMDAYKNPTRTATQSLLEDTSKLKDIVSRNRSNIANIGKGVFGGGLTNYLQGYTNFWEDMVNNKSIQDLNTKIGKLQSGQDVEFSEDEKVLLKAFVDNIQTQEALGDRIPDAYRIGEATGQSIGFMLEFAGTGGVVSSATKFFKGVPLLAKAVTAGRATQGGRFLTASAAKAAQAGIQTAAQPTMYQKVAINVSNGMSGGEALFDAYYDQWVENFSERVFIGKLVPGAAEKSIFNQAFARLGTTLNMDRGAVGVLINMVEETTEEKIGEVLRAPKDHDSFKSFWDQFWSWEENKIMLGSVGLMTGVLGSPVMIGSAVESVSNKVKLERLKAVLPKDVLNEIDVIYENGDLTHEEALKLVKGVVDSRIGKVENINEFAGNVLSYAYEKSKGAAMAATTEGMIPTEVAPEVTEQVETEVVETEPTEVVPETTEVAPEVETAPEMTQPEAGVETIEPTRVISPESTKTSEYEKEEGLQETEVEETPAPEAVVEQPEQVVGEKIKVFRGTTKKGTLGTQENEGFLWVAEDKTTAMNYAVPMDKTDEGRVDEMEVDKPTKPFELPFKSNVDVRATDIGAILMEEIGRKFESGEITEAQMNELTDAVSEYEKQSGNKLEKWHTLVNKPKSSRLFANIISGLGYDSLLVYEGANKTNPTYGIVKPVEPTQPPVERVSREEGAITPTAEKGAVKPSEEKAKKLPEEIRFIEEELPSKKPKKGDEIEIPDDMGEINVKPIPVKIKKNDTVSAIAPLTSKDSFMASMGGVYHDAENQVLVATDSHVIIIIPEKIEGKSRTIDPKTNTEIEGKFPNYKAVIPNNEEKATVKISDIIDDVAGVARLNDFVKIPSDKIPVGIALGGEWSNHRFDAKKMLPLLKAFAETGTTDVIFEVGEGGRGTVIRDANNRNKYAVIMPIVQIGGNFKTINVSPKGAPKEQVKEVATKLEITPKSARDLLRVAEEVFGLKGEQAIQFASVADLMFKAMAKRRNIPAKDRYKSLPISFRKGYESELKDALQKLQETGNIARGAMQQLANGQYIIYALTDPNISTPLHELAHVFESYLTESELKSIESWSNTKRGTREFKEAFAVGFEDYLRDGVAPNDKMKAVFEKFKKWLTDIYKSTVGIPLNDDMRRIYDSIIEGGVAEIKGDKGRVISPLDELKNLTKDIQWQIIGEKGAEALDKAQEATTRLDNLAVARDMEKSGKDAKSIRYATGWERGADNMWRYEIPDIVLTDEYLDFDRVEAYFPLPEAIEGRYSNELFKAYPQLKDVELVLRENRDEAGSWDGYFINISTYVGDVDKTKNREKITSVVLHEIQHAIQDIEGFAKGGQVVEDTVDDDVIDKIFEMLPMDKIGEIMERNNIPGDYLGENPIEWLKSMRPHISNIDDRLYLHNVIEQKSQDVWRIWNQNSGFNKYYKIAGEVEARNVQTRFGMTEAERRATLLEETEDVARKDQNIIRTFGLLFQTTKPVIPETVKVDGKERPTRNSEGNYISNSIDGITNFWKWFGDSKVVDKDGRPLVVYHGTERGGFSVFDTSRYADISGAGKRVGAFFTDKKSTASSYAGSEQAIGVSEDYFDPRVSSKSLDKEYAKNKIYKDASAIESLHIAGTRYLLSDSTEQERNFDYEDIIGITGSKKLADEYISKRKEIIGKNKVVFSGIYPVYLNISSPTVADFKGKTWDKGVFNGRPVTTNTLGELAKKMGSDGAIINNVIEIARYGEGMIERKDRVSNTYIAFEPTQIKSVFNTGTFSPENANILFQTDPAKARAMGIVRNEVDRMGQTLKGDELREAVFDYLKDVNMPPHIINQILDEYAKATTQPAQEAGREKRSERKKERGVHLRDDAKDRKEGTRESSLGLRVNLSDETLTQEFRDAVAEKGIRYAIQKHSQLYEAAVSLMKSNSIAEVDAAFRNGNTPIELRTALGIELIRYWDGVAAKNKGNRTGKDAMTNSISVYGHLDEILSRGSGRAISYLGSLYAYSVLAPRTRTEKVKREVTNYREEEAIKMRLEERIKELQSELARVNEEAAKAVSESKELKDALDKVKKQRNLTKEYEIRKTRVLAGIKRQEAKDKLADALDALADVLVAKKNLGGVDFSERKKDVLRNLVDAVRLETEAAGLELKAAVQSILSKMGMYVDDVDIDDIIGISGEDLEMEEDTFDPDKQKDAADKLATRIKNLIKDKKRKDDPIVQMLSQLTAKFKEGQPKRDVEQKSTLDIIVEALQDREYYMETWTSARDKAIELVKRSRMSETKKKDAIDEINSVYDQATRLPFSVGKAEKLVREELGKLDIEIGKIVSDHYSKKVAVRDELVRTIIEKTGLTQEQAELLEEAITLAFNRITLKKKDAILRAHIKRYEKKAQPVQPRKGAQVFDPTRHKSERAAQLLELSNIGAFYSNEFREAYLTAMGLPEITQEQLDRFEELADKVSSAPEGRIKNKALLDLLEAEANLKPFDWGEFGMALWYFNILSGYTTQARNAIENMTQTFMELDTSAKYALATGRVDMVFGMLKALGRGWFKKGIPSAKDVMITGYSPFRGKLEVPPIAERVVFKGLTNWMGFNLVKYLTRTMSAVDEIFYEGLKEMRAYELARLNIDIERGWMFDKSKKDEIKAKIRQQLNYSPEVVEAARTQAQEEAQRLGLSSNEQKIRFFEILEQGRDRKIVDDVHTFASEGTFNHATYGLIGFLSDYIGQMAATPKMKVRMYGKDYTLEPGRLFVPFTRIIANSANRKLSYTPIGAIRAIQGRVGITAGLPSAKYRYLSKEERWKEAIKAMTGISLAFMFYLLSDPGDDNDPIIEITANGTGDYKKNRTLEIDGWQPYSIKIGNEWISYKFTPLLLMLAPIGFIRDIEKYKTGGEDLSKLELIERGMYTIPTMLVDETALSGASSLMDIIKKGGVMSAREVGSGVKKFLARTTISAFQPNIYKQTVRQIDAIMEKPLMEATSWTAHVLAEVPVAGRFMKNGKIERVNVFGESIPTSSIVPQMIGFKSEGTHEYAKWCVENNALPSTPERATTRFNIEFSGGDVQYTALVEGYEPHDELWVEFQKLRGEKIKEGLSNLMSRGLDKEENQKEAQKIYSNATDFAKMQLQIRITQLASVPKK